MHTRAHLAELGELVLGVRELAHQARGLAALALAVLARLGRRSGRLAPRVLRRLELCLRLGAVRVVVFGDAARGFGLPEVSLPLQLLDRLARARELGLRARASRIKYLRPFGPSKGLALARDAQGAYDTERQ